MMVSLLMKVARFSSTELITIISSYIDPRINHAYFRHIYIRSFRDEILTAIFVLFSICSLLAFRYNRK